MNLLEHPIFGTDLIFHRAGGRVEDRGDHLLVLTPGNPTFYWGNCLIFKAPPTEADRERWNALFEASIVAVQPQSKHRAYGWVGAVGAAAAFAADGLTLWRSEALTCARPVLPHVEMGDGGQPTPASSRLLVVDRPDVVVREIETDTDWQAAIDLHVLCRDECHTEAAYRDFKTRQFAQYRRMQAEGVGARYGAFVGGVLACELGVYAAKPHAPGGLGRYNNVCTHPGFRRQGLAGLLVFEGGTRAIARWGLRQLVIVTDGEAAQRVYRSAGFALSQHHAWGMDRPPP